MTDERQRRLAAAVLDRCRSRSLRLGIAESCTGGLVAAAITAVAGCSDVFDRGFVAYANAAKADMLGVADRLIAEHGAVSESVARAMAEGVLARSRATVSVAVTGIAGPGGGTPAKPVGLVHIAAARAGHPTLHRRHVFPGDRDAVRDASVTAALELLLRQLADAGDQGRLGP